MDESRMILGSVHKLRFSERGVIPAPIFIGVNPSRATEGRRSEPKRASTSSTLLDAPVSSTGQAPQVRHDGLTDFIDRQYSVF